MRYEERIVDEVQSLNDIVEVVSNYIPLKRSGRTFKALCPFHSEKTPSFVVHPEKQIFHCFGCGAGGDVFSFVMRHENSSFPEAIRNLAERVHYTLPEPSRKMPEEISESKALYDAYQWAQEYYTANLRDPQKGLPARDYLSKRGFGTEALAEFSLGWALPDWRGLFEFLSRKGVKDPILYQSGLVARSREGHPYDLFRGRLLFPILNLQGKVIAFGGRTLGEEGPKYLNSSESPIFRKRRELFGLNWAKRHLSTSEPRILVVEGYFDFLRVYTSGFKNVVATLGTALTEEHVRVLKRFVQEAVVIYDGDSAGEAAALRGLEVFLEGEVSVKVAVLPAGKDPDSFIQEMGPGPFGKILEEARDFFDFKWEILSRRHRPKDPAGLLRISREFIETFSKVKNPVLLDHYLKRLSGLLGVGEGTLRSELAKATRKVQTQKSESSKEEFRFSSAGQQPEESMLLSLILEDSDLFEKARSLLSVDDFGNAGAREAFRLLQTAERKGASKYPSLLNRVAEESVKSVVTAHALAELSAPERERAFQDCVNKIKEQRLKEKLERLRHTIQEAERTEEGSRVAELLGEYQSLLAEKGRDFLKRSI